jgi:hypothetical protein
MQEKSQFVFNWVLSRIRHVLDYPKAGMHAWYPKCGNNDDSLNCRSAVKGMPNNLDVKLVLAEVYEDVRKDAKALELVNDI